MIDLTEVTTESTAEETESRVKIDDVAGKTLLIYRAEELPSRFGKGTYFRLFAQIEDTGQKVTFTVPNRRARDIVEHMRKLKSQLDQGKKVRARIIRETYHYHRYVLGVAPAAKGTRQKARQQSPRVSTSYRNDIEQGDKK